MNDVSLPLVKELTPAPDVEAALRAFAPLPHCLLLDSAMRHAELGRYSFLAADPFDYVERPVGSPDPLGELQRRCERFTAKTIPGLPPFQGGAAGLLSYDLGRSLEKIPATAFDEFALPQLAIGFYDVVLAWDHVAHRAWLISHGFPETDEKKRLRRAQQRIEELWDGFVFRPDGLQIRPTCQALPDDALAPQFAMTQLDGLTSTFSHEAYVNTVQRVIDYIHAGDVFQVNLSQRLLYPDDGDPISLYLRLRQKNPATFAGYFSGCDFQIASASPERFIKLSDGQLETRPIKGTRHRSPLPEADLFTGDALRASEKDRAENVMIVDLLRNDLSRVCDADSIHVSDLCRLEVYETVQHLVSVVQGRLRKDCTPIDVLRATFPGGSITGAPKVRAMEIIAELEPTARGAYCGSMGYVGFDGTMDFNILIRTITLAKGWRQLQVGGGIVAQSDPQAEYEETWHKAVGMLRAL